MLQSGFPVFSVIVMRLNRVYVSYLEMCLSLTGKQNIHQRGKHFYNFLSDCVYSSLASSFCCRLLDCVCVCCTGICARERERRGPSPCVSGERRILIAEMHKHIDSCIV